MGKPKLRFRGYIDDWEQRKLEDIVTEVKRTDENSSAPVMMITANDGFINQSDRYSTNNAGQSLKKYILLEKGELAYNHGASKLRPYGSCFALTTEEKARIPFVYHCFSANEDNPEFLSIILNGKNVERQLRRIVSSGARMDGLLNISFDEYTSIPILIPEKSEQNKIAKYFGQLDHLITLHQRKCEEMKKLKKYMLQKMFPKKGMAVPEIRFDGFTDDWEQRKLGEIADKVSEKNKNNEFSEPFTNSAEQGIISQKEYFDREIVNNENLNGYYIVKNDDFIYNPRISVTAPVGPINRNRLGRNGVMSPLYTVFRTHDIDNLYLEFYFKTTKWHRFMKLNGDSGARFDRFTISSTQFMEMPIPYPTLDEQIKIGEYFDNFDHLITLHQRKCEELQKLKKFMLQNMFV